VDATMSTIAENAMNIFVDSHKLNVIMAMEGVRTDEDLETRSSVTARTIRNVRQTGRCSFDTLEKLATALEHNPLDFLTTSGFPVPKSDAPAFASLVMN